MLDDAIHRIGEPQYLQSKNSDRPDQMIRPLTYDLGRRLLDLSGSSVLGQAFSHPYV